MAGSPVRRDTNFGYPIVKPLNVAYFHYKFSERGGAVGAITLGTMPKNSVIVNAEYITTTAFTSGGSATVEVGVSGATACIIAQAAFDNAAFTADTAKLGVPDFATVGDHKVLTADTDIILTVGTAALTAGELYLALTYIEMPVA